MPETYLPIAWHNDQSPAINETNLNRIEQGVEAIDVRTALLELGVITPVTLTYSSSITINATLGTLFRCTATGDLTLDNIVGGMDGQTIIFQVLASGASRSIDFTGDVATVVVPPGQIWAGRFTYWLSIDTWFLAD